jgi:signal transduction histidine kinase
LIDIDMDSRLRILHLEDEATDSALVGETLEAAGFRCDVTRVDSQPAFCELLEAGGFDLILADFTLPSFDGLAALKLAAERRPEVPFIFISGTEGRTRRTEAERALRRSESYLKEAQRLSHTGSFGVDRSSGRIRWSEETFRIFGLEPGTTPTAELILQRTHPEDRLLVEQTIDSVFREGKQFDVEHRLLMPDGSVKHLRVVGHPLENQLEFVGAVTDLTESRRAEAERRRAQEALRAKEMELAHAARVMTMGEMAASIAHEMNQPLSAIILHGKACLRWLSGEHPDPTELREALKHIVDDASRAGEVVARIRALARKTPTEKGPLDLNETIEQVGLLARGELLKNRVSLHTELRENLSPVVGDRIQLQQLLLNLFINAVEAMSEVADRPRQLVVATGDHDSRHVFVAVRDTGVGLDPGGREHIFDAFYTTKPNGMGMGLSISRSIVENHGGKLWAEPNDGPGTTFRVTIPKAS